MKGYTSKKRVLYNQLANEFTEFLNKFEKIAHNEVNGMYCYKRTTSEGLTCYEVFKAPKETRGAGEPYERYPSSSEFGFGAVLCIRNDKSATDKIAFCISNGFTAGRFQA